MIFSVLIAFLNEAHAISNTLPVPASDVASRWDSLYAFLVWLSVFFFVLIVGGMIWFAIKYRRKPGAKSEYITGSHVIEAIWTVIPAILLMVIFGWGYSVYNDMTVTPSDAYEVKVVGKQWEWLFYYDDGRSTVGKVYVPVNKPVRFLMTAKDVLHSFFIPNFRVKQDVVPGMYTSVWFEANVPGRHQIYCTEYCGGAHSGMVGEVYALKDADWERWVRGEEPQEGNVEKIGLPGVKITQAAPTTNLVEQGKKLYQTRTCIACHTTDGSKSVGPTFKGLFGKEEELADGSKVKVDENYIRESIEKPNAKITKGFPPAMPPMSGLTETDYNALIAFIKSLK